MRRKSSNRFLQLATIDDSKRDMRDEAQSVRRVRELIGWTASTPDFAVE